MQFGWTDANTKLKSQNTIINIGIGIKQVVGDFKNKIFIVFFLKIVLIHQM